MIFDTAKKVPFEFFRQLKSNSTRENDVITLLLLQNSKNFRIIPTEKIASKFINFLNLLIFRIYRLNPRIS